MQFSIPASSKESTTSQKSSASTRPASVYVHGGVCNRGEGGRGRERGGREGGRGEGGRGGGRERGREGGREGGRGRVKEGEGI